MKIKKLLGLLAIPALLTVTGCDLNNAKNNVQSAINNVVESFEVDSEGHFKSEKKYDINGTIGSDGLETQYSFEYTFKTNGDVDFKDKGNENNNYTKKYTVDSNLIIVDEGDYKTYIDYYEDVIVVPVESHLAGKRMYLGCVCGNLSGVAVSQRGKTTLGYHIELNVKVGDLPAVFTGNSKSKGNYIKIYKNGEIYSKSSCEYYYSYIKADQVSDFDSSKAGETVVNVTIGSKEYKAVLRVEE